ncbi:DUF4153 domain-containing protein [Clostridium sp.]|uniref:DUF4153 domain-containing protein n=1 Tax=Clostridium sp. TaxID=1506 RepID=UPI0026104DC6|nr:DUF4173 domain-containing protein [Clostridium sp.]
MVNVVSLVLMKGEKILLLKRPKNRLPIINMKNGETPEECVSRWSTGVIELEDAPTIKYNKKVTTEGYNIDLIFIDATNSNIEIIDKDLIFEGCKWANNINKVENELFRYIIIQCSINNYTSIAVEALKETLNMKRYKSNKPLMDIEKDNMDSNKAIILIILSLGIGILFSRFIFGYFGVSVPILTILMIGIFMFTVDIKNNNVLGYFFVLVSIILSCSYAIFTNELFRILNVLVIPLSLFSGFLLLTYNNIPFQLLNFGNAFLEIIIGQSIENTTKLPSVVKYVFKKDILKKENNYIKSILTGIVISVPLLIVLGALLAGADEVFSYHLRNIWVFLNIENIYDFILKSIIAIVVMFLVFGLYYSLNATKIKEVRKRNINKSFDSTTIITILFSLIVLYLVFTKIQISYLYLNKQLPVGFDFAHYARSGFFQLVFLVLINLVMITAMNFKTLVKGDKTKNALNILYSIITVLTVNMGVSAMFKMNLYISEFGYTRLRILVQVFTVFLCLSLLILFIFIWKNKYLFKPIVVLALSMYIALNYFNIDNYIAKQNMVIVNVNNGIDDGYLSTLSLDAGEAVKEGYEKGLIESEYYFNWFHKKVTTKHWYEYNYFNSRILR